VKKSRGFCDGDIKHANMWATQMNPDVDCFGISTTSPPDVWFTKVKNLAVGQDIELLSHANLLRNQVASSLI
jgi:hypothetical protein